MKEGKGRGKGREGWGRNGREGREGMGGHFAAREWKGEGRKGKEGREGTGIKGEGVSK